MTFQFIYTIITWMLISVDVQQRSCCAPLYYATIKFRLGLRFGTEYVEMNDRVSKLLVGYMVNRIVLMDIRYHHWNMYKRWGRAQNMMFDFGWYQIWCSVDTLWCCKEESSLHHNVSIPYQIRNHYCMILNELFTENNFLICCPRWRKIYKP